MREWPKLGEPGITVAELGCGVGNSTLPMLESNPTMKLFCCDFSPAGVELLRKELQERELLTSVPELWVADVSQVSQIDDYIPRNGCDVSMLIFVLSAVPPSGWLGVVEAAARSTAKGGVLLLRDYASGDAAQQRFERTPGARVFGNGGCVRGDGTQAHFFAEKQLSDLFDGPFETVSCVIKVQPSQAEGGMLRRFVHATFRRK